MNRKKRKEVDVKNKLNCSAILSYNNSILIFKAYTTCEPDSLFGIHDIT